MQLMHLKSMDCSSVRSSNVGERDSDLGEDLSHDEHSDDEMRDCDSVEGNIEQRHQQQRQQQQHHQQQQQQQQQIQQHHHHQQHHLSATHHHRSSRRLNSTLNSGGDMSFVGTSTASAAGGIGSGGGRSPVEQTELQMSHHHQFPPNHPLNALGSFMGIGGLHGIPNLQHSDVLEKLKMQVRDMKVGLMEQDYAAHAAAFGANVLPTPINTAFTLPPTSTMSSFGHVAAGNGSVANGSPSTGHSASNTTSSHPNGAGGGGGGGGGGGSGSGNFSFASPTPPNSKDVNPASNSSTSSETSNSSTQQNNGWSFEEQYKQVRQLYEINDDPKRKEFLDELFQFMQKRGTPINRLPIMAKSVLDLYELYNLVIARGGLVEVINKKLWQEIIKGLHLPSSITSAAFTLRTQYMKYLYPFECDKLNLSAPAELQAAIDGNRREGRRSSYGQYEAIHNQIQMPQIARQSLAGSMQQMSPLALVTHAAAANNQQAHAAAAAAAAHHRLIAPTFGQMPNLVTHEIEQRMMEYLKLIQVKKEHTAAVISGGGASVSNGGTSSGTGNSANSLVAAAAAAQQQQQQQLQQQVARQSSQSPEISTRDALNALEMSRVALWQMYHNNTSPPASVNTSPQLISGGVGSVGGGEGSAASLNGVEPQREALNLSDTPPFITNIKREREHEPSPDDSKDFHQPPTKRSAFPTNLPAGFPASFYHGMAAAAAANFQQHAANATHHHHNTESDVEQDDDADDDGEHNTTGNTSLHDEQEHLNGHLRHSHNLRHDRDRLMHTAGAQHHNDKSDDSAIENSPTTSTSVGNGHISPISTKKLHLSKQSNGNSTVASTSVGATTACKEIDPVETLNLLSGLQFRVAKSGTNANGEQQLVVNLELNGLKYSGVLTAKAVSRAVEALSADEPTERTKDSSDLSTMSTSIVTSNTDKDIVLEANENVNEDDESESEAETNPVISEGGTAGAAAVATTPKVKISSSTTTTTTEAAILNGPSNIVAPTTTTLKDSLITT